MASLQGVGKPWSGGDDHLLTPRFRFSLRTLFNTRTNVCCHVVWIELAQIAQTTGRNGTLLPAECEPIMQTIQSLTQQILEIDYVIGGLEAEAMQLNPLQYVVSQRKVDRFNMVKQTLQEKWNNAMNELAICRLTYPAHGHFDQDHVSLGR